MHLILPQVPPIISGLGSSTLPHRAAGEILKRIYSGPKDSKGEHLFPGLPSGGPAGLLRWSGWITGFSPEKNAQFGFGTQFFANNRGDQA